LLSQLVEFGDVAQGLAVAQLVVDGIDQGGDAGRGRFGLAGRFGCSGAIAENLRPRVERQLAFLRFLFLFFDGAELGSPNGITVWPDPPAINKFGVLNAADVEFRVIRLRQGS